MISSTDKYYENNSRDYFQRTVGADVSHLYKHFLNLLPKGGRILDAGSGSGRDLREFSKLGYSVLGVDSSSALAQLATAYSGEKVVVSKLQKITFQNAFDGVWACASLLHCKRNILPKILKNFHDALFSDGVLFVSVREGNGRTRSADGRAYTLYTLRQISSLVESSHFQILSTWKTRDVIEGREELIWINVLAKKATV